MTKATPRWLLIIAWPWGALALWKIFRSLVASRVRRWSLIVASWTVVAVVLLLVGLVWLKSPSMAVHSNGPDESSVFGIHKGAAWISPEFSMGLYWVSFNGTKKITPIHVLAFYTITNRKSTPIMISEMSLEMLGAHNTWWTLNNLPTEQPIWAADLGRDPEHVSLITLTDGALIANTRNVELEAGRSVRGWMLCQLPTDFAPLRDKTSLQLRLKIRDTAGDEGVQLPETPSTNDNVLSASFHFEPVPNVNLRDYEVVTYGPQ